MLAWRGLQQLPTSAWLLLLSSRRWDAVLYCQPESVVQKVGCPGRQLSRVSPREAQARDRVRQERSYVAEHIATTAARFDVATNHGTHRMLSLSRMAVFEDTIEFAMTAFNTRNP